MPANSTKMQVIGSNSDLHGDNLQCVGDVYLFVAGASPAARNLFESALLLEAADRPQLDRQTLRSFSTRSFFAASTR
jgi:hypothetical protein